MQTQIKPTYALWITAILSMLSACNSGKSSGLPGSDTLRVMTYNIHHANPPSKAADSIIDIQAIANVINKAKPDLVALQEVDVHTNRSGKDLDEAKKLAELTGMHYFFTQSIDYDGGAYGIAVLSRFSILDSISYHLPIAEGAKEEVRSICMIKVKLNESQEIYFSSTHLGLSAPTRLLQAKKMADILQSISLPVIIGGDFNATPESKTIQLLDSVMTRSCTDKCPFTIPVENPNRTIDYIMYKPSDAFKTVSVNTIPETYASDHLPVIVTLVY